MELKGNRLTNLRIHGDLKGIRLTNLGIHVEFIGNSFDKSGNSCGIYREFV